MKAFKNVNGALFTLLGIAVVVQTLRFAGFRFEAVTGIVLGGAMIALGVLRLRQARQT